METPKVLQDLKIRVNDRLGFPCKEALLKTLELLEEFAELSHMYGKENHIRWLNRKKAAEKKFKEWK